MGFLETLYLASVPEIRGKLHCGLHIILPDTLSEEEVEWKRNCLKVTHVNSAFALIRSAFVRADS